jgi:hypothetical protein
MANRGHLRLVPREPPPRPSTGSGRRRYLTRISVATPHQPIGRSRTFHLTEDDFLEVIAVAERMEAS